MEKQLFRRGREVVRLTAAVLLLGALVSRFAANAAALAIALLLLALLIRAAFELAAAVRGSLVPSDRAPIAPGTIERDARVLRRINSGLYVIIVMGSIALLIVAVVVKLR